jgi:CubicO group peptidase (beta-lactamase class C family)
MSSQIGVAILARQGKRVPTLSAAPHLARGLADDAPDAAPYDAIDAYLEQQLRRLRVPGAAVAIVEGDRVAHWRGFGRSHLGGAPPSPQTPFVLGSVTKSFTALSVKQLVEAGKIELDAPVQRHLPWFHVADPRASAQMTVRNLLNQTSGLPTTRGWVAMADFDQSPGSAERQARALPILWLTHPVGAAFRYTNTNYDLLGLIVEAASGEGYAAYVQDLIFAPLDMRHSFATRAGAQQHGLARGHRYWFGYPVPAPELPDPRGSLASSQLIASAKDVAHYLIALLNGGRYDDARVLSPAGVAELHRPAVAAKQGILRGHDGMGWFVEDGGPTRTVWHDGVVPDFFAYAALLPEQKQGFVLLLNANHFEMVPALSEIGDGVGRLLAGDRPAPGRFGLIPWALRGLPSIPAVKVVGVAATLRRVRRWRRDPESLPPRRQFLGAPDPAADDPEPADSWRLDRAVRQPPAPFPEALRAGRLVARPDLRGLCRGLVRGAHRAGPPDRTAGQRLRWCTPGSRRIA